MRLFEARPLAAWCALFCAASVLAFRLDGSVKLILIIASALCAAALSAASFWPSAARIKEYRVRIVSFALSVIAAFSLSFVSMNVVYASYKALDGDAGEVSGYVIGTVYETGYGSAYRVKLTKIGGEDRRVGAILETESDAGLAIGDAFSADVEFSALGVENGFDEEAYYLPRGVRLRAAVAGPGMLTVGGEAPGLRDMATILAAKAQAWISDRLNAALEGRGGNGLAEALLVGDRGGIEDSLYRDFKYIGATHLLAVSGLHLTILIGAADGLLRRFLNRTPRNALLIVLTAAYMALTGFSASVTRAGIMMIIFYAAYFVRRAPDSVTSLFVASAVIMAASPASAGDIGLLLSVAAMLGCLFANDVFVSNAVSGAFSRLASRGGACVYLSKTARWIYSSLAVSFAALLFTLPTVWLTFGRVSLLSPLSALLLTLPVTGIQYLAPFVAATAGCGVLSAIVSFPCGALCVLTGKIASLLSEIEGVGIPLGDASLAGFVCAFMAVCLFSALVLGKKGARRSAAAACGVFFIVCAAVTVRAHTFTEDSVEYINYGKNDAFAVTDGTRVLVCDVSDGSWTPTSRAVEAGKAAGAERIDVYMLTHLHRRHIATLSKLCGREYIRAVWLPLPETEDEKALYDELAAVASSAGVRVFGYRRGETLDFGSVTVGTAPRTMIKRSTHPVIAAVFETEAERVTYIGASIHESELFGDAADMCVGAGTVVFGIHGPVYKSGASLGLDADTRVVFASQSVADMMSGHNRTREFYVYGE